MADQSSLWGSRRLKFYNCFDELVCCNSYRLLPPLSHALSYDQRRSYRARLSLHTPRRRSHSAIHSAHFARDVENLRLLGSTYNTSLLSLLLRLQMPTTVIGCSATTATWMAMLFGLCPVWLFLYYVDCGAEADPAFRFCYCYRCSDATNERVRIGDGTEQHSTPYSPAPGLKNI